MSKRFAILYDKDHYIDNIGFEPERAAAYRVRLWDKDDLEVVGEVPPGARLEILEESEDSYHVRATDGTEQEGWIRRLQAERVEGE